MDLKETRVGREEIYDGIVVHLTKDTVRLPDGKTGIREVVWHRGAVCVVPVTDEGEVVLVQQFRYAMDRELWEIPAGKLEVGETDRAAAARRELEEETGLRCRELIDFGDYYGSPAIFSERISMYLALGLEQGESHPDEDEFLWVKKFPLDELCGAILRGEIPDGKTQAAVLRAKLWLEQNGK